MNSLLLKAKKRNSFFYVESNDDYLSMLFHIFNETGFFLDGFKRQLLNPLSRGYTGNETSVIIKEEKVTIRLSMIFDNYDEYAITIDRTKLLNLIDKWQEIIKIKPDEIIFKRIDDSIEIEPIFYEKLNK
ncbi:MAG: hypothetical protein OHK0036_18770 [Bacteroidia bacterium]